MYEVTPLVAIFKNLIVSIAALLTAAAAIVALHGVRKGINAWQRERERKTCHYAAVAVL